MGWWVGRPQQLLRRVPESGTSNWACYHNVHKEKGEHRFGLNMYTCGLTYIYVKTNEQNKSVNK